ncbi:MAG: VapE family protein [Saprospiraceae bacterium]|nr:VapE family protein [Saprospiraceae bacterium]
MTKATNSPSISFQGKNRLKSPVSQYKGIGKTLQGYATISDIFDLMQGEQLKPLSTQLHNAKQESPQAYKRIKERDCPAFITGKFPKKEDAACEVYTGLVVFDIDHCVADFCVAENIRMLKSSPFVFAAFPSVSGLGVRVMVWCDSKPETHKAYYEAFCAHLSEVLNIPTDKSLRATLKEQGKAKAEIDAEIEQTEIIDTSTNNIARIWFYSHVPSDLFYLNLDSHVYVLKDLQKTTNKHTRLPKQPFVQLAISEDDRVKVALDKVHRQNIGTGRNNFVYAFASEMCRHGVSMDTALMECAAYEQSDFEQAEIKKTVKSAYDSKKFGEFQDGQIAKYKTLVNGQTKAAKQVTPTTANDTPVKENPPQASGTPENAHREQPKIIKMKRLLSERYDFRLNIIANEIEYRSKGKDNFVVLNENDLIVELLEAGFTGVEQPLIALLKSSFVSRYNPFWEYFKSLPKWGETQPDYITELANYVDAKDQFWFNTQFKKMLVRTIACALEIIPFNKHCFTLKGEQHDGKSTFLRFLVPKTLENYITEHIELNNKDGLFALSQNFLINLDELSQFPKADINKIKAFITVDKTKARLPFDKKPTVHPRRASFVASTNDDEFLIDSTGNVRWLIFEINGVRHDNGGAKGYAASVDIDRVWAQAYSLLQSGFDFKLSTDEIAKSEGNNRQFQMTTIEMELIQDFYKPAQKEEDGAIFVTATDIEKRIAPETRSSIALRNVGRALKILGFEKAQKHDPRSGYQKKGYWAKAIESTD